MIALASVLLGAVLFLGWLFGNPACAALMTLILSVSGAAIGAHTADQELMSKVLFGLGFGFVAGAAVGMAPYLFLRRLARQQRIAAGWRNHQLVSEKHGGRNRSVGTIAGEWAGNWISSKNRLR